MILFITRKYPPAIGGMEKLNYHLIAAVRRKTPVTAIVWGGSQIWLPAFAIWAFGRGLVVLLTRRVRAVHIGDAVLSPLGLLLQSLTGVPVFVTAHGLDVTYANPLYQVVTRACLRRLAGVVCNSEFTRLACLERGVSPSRCTVIHPGVPVFHGLDRARERRGELERIAGRSLAGRKLVLSVGRLVERKGLAWFVGQVLPALVSKCPDLVYLICGAGPQRAALEAEVQRLDLGTHVCVLGQVEDRVLRAAYACADVFVMPNIVIAGNPEGFGFVTLEARAAGTPVVAANVQGVGESITPGVDGLLVSPGDAQGFLTAVLQVLRNDAHLLPREGIRAHMIETAGWAAVADTVPAGL